MEEYSAGTHLCQTRRDHGPLTVRCAASQRDLAFAAFLAGLEHARMPLIIVRVDFAKPALAGIAENRRGRVAGLVHAGDTLTQRFGFRAGILFGLLCSHGSTFVRAFYSCSAKTGMANRANSGDCLLAAPLCLGKTSQNAAVSRYWAVSCRIVGELRFETGQSVRTKTRTTTLPGADLRAWKVKHGPCVQVRPPRRVHIDDGNLET